MSEFHQFWNIKNPSPESGQQDHNLYSYISHLSVSGVEALVTCGMMESLLKVINWYGDGQEHITVSISRFIRFNKYMKFYYLITYCIQIFLFIFRITVGKFNMYSNPSLSRQHWDNSKIGSLNRFSGRLI